MTGGHVLPAMIGQPVRRREDVDRSRRSLPRWERVQETIAYCQADPPKIFHDLQREERLMAASGMNDPDYKSGPAREMLSRARGRSAIVLDSS